MMLEAFLLKRTIEIGCLKLGLLLNLCKIIIPYLTLLEPYAACTFRHNPLRKANWFDVLVGRFLMLLLTSVAAAQPMENGRGMS